MCLSASSGLFLSCTQEGISAAPIDIIKQFLSASRLVIFIELF